MGSLILKKVVPGSEASIEAFLAGLFKKASPEQLRAIVRKAPTVLTRSISEKQAVAVVARLNQLGAAAEFRSEMPSPAPGIPDVAPAASASDTVGTSQPVASGGAETAQPAAPVSPAAATHDCSQCGRAYPEDELLFYEDMWVCAACKPDFVQRLKEGQRVEGQLIYAGFWIRGGAKIVDWIIILTIGFVVTFLMNLMGGITGGANPTVFILITNLLKILLAALYSTWFIGRYAATPGKMACGLKVVMPDGANVSYARALGRHFAEWISSMILGIGYLMAAFDSEKRALHDRICGTRVVKK